MPVVAMPDGANVQFPDDMPKEQIKSLIASKFPDAVKSGPKSFMERVDADIANRTEQLQGPADAYAAGEQTMGETMAQQGLKYAQIAPDVATEVLKSGFYSLPQGAQDTIQKGASNVYTAIKDSPVGDLASQAVQKYKGFEQEHPRAARNLGAMGDAVNLLASVTPIKGQSVAGRVGGAVDPAIVGTVKGAAKLGGKVASASVPGIDEGLRDVATMARQYDIPLSVDQITDSKPLKNMQKISQELPFSGYSSFRDKQLSKWQENLLKTVGVEGDKFTKNNMDKAFSTVGKEFDDLGKGKTFDMSNFNNQVAEVRDEAQGYATKDAIGNFDFMLQKVLRDVGEDGAISGEKLGTLRSAINSTARKANNEDTRSLLHDLENAVVDTMTAGDDMASAGFSETKKKYKNLLALEPLVAKAKGGVISPRLLNDRVNKIYGRSHVRGQAGPIGDLAQIGYELLPELGGSDTAQKLMYATGATGAGIANLPITAGALTGNRVLQATVNRNQGLVDKLLTAKEIGKLPPAEARKVLKAQKTKKGPK